MIMRINLKYTAIAGAVIAIIAFGIAAITGKDDAKKGEMGPEAVVEAFNRAVTAGDWSAAEGLCNAVSMKEYLESHQEAWETLQKEDSTALQIAASLLSGAVMEFCRIEKSEDGRAVHYTLEADGHRKERKAIVKKNAEGEWKIENITDAI